MKVDNFLCTPPSYQLQNTVIPEAFFLVGKTFHILDNSATHHDCIGTSTTHKNYVWMSPNYKFHFYRDSRSGKFLDIR
jgi:hypothetical protein